MKTSLLILLGLVCLLCFSCKSNYQQLREKILPIITNVILSDSLAFKIDSIHIYKIDTLTDLEISKRRIINLSSKETSFMQMAESYQSEAKLKNESARLTIQQGNLLSAMHGDKSLILSEASNAKADLNEASDLTKKSALYIDSESTALTQIKAIEAKIKTNKINKNNFIGYKVLFKLLGSDKKNVEVKKDSLFVYLSPSFRIIPVNSIY